MLENQGNPNEGRMDIETAHTEAEVLRGFADNLRVAVQDGAKENPAIADWSKLLKETGWLELGSQRLEQIKLDDAELYENVMSRQDAIDRLTETILPSHCDIGWDHYIPFEKAKQLAQKLPVAEQEKARESAKGNAEAVVSQVTNKVMKKIVQNNSYTRSPIYVSEAIETEIEDGHVLNNRYIPAQIGALTEAVLANVNLDRLSKRKNQSGMTLETSQIVAAFKKQMEFNNATATPIKSDV
jgi:hypothetical protein